MAIAYDENLLQIDETLEQVLRLPFHCNIVLTVLL